MGQVQTIFKSATGDFERLQTSPKPDTPEPSGNGSSNGNGNGNAHAKNGNSVTPPAHNLLDPRSPTVEITRTPIEQKSSKASNGNSRRLVPKFLKKHPTHERLLQSPSVNADESSSLSQLANGNSSEQSSP